MAFNIRELSGQLGKHGIQKGNLFRFTIPSPPPGLWSTPLPTAMPQRDLQFFCRSVTLPEFDLNTSEVQPQAFGPVVRRPQSMNFPILPAVFTVDGDMKVVSFFHRWTQLIINYNKESGNYGEVNGALPFEMGYKSEYATKVIVDVYNEYGEDIYQYIFSGCYPVQVGQVETAWANTDESLTLSVGFSYDTLEVTGTSAPRQTNVGNVLAPNPFSATGSGLKEITSDAEERERNENPDAHADGKILTKKGWRWPLSDFFGGN